MKPKSIKILGVRIDLLTIGQINDLIISVARKRYDKPTVIFKPYVEFLSLASKNEEIKNLLNDSDINVADSTAIQWAASYLYGNPSSKAGSLSTYYSLLYKLQSDKWRNQIVPERMAGIDQTLPLLKLANSCGLRVGILGGPKEYQKTQKVLSKKFPKLKIRVWSGYYSPEKEAEIVDQIAKYKPDILFCALGFPKQERFAIKYKNALHAKVIIGEGGSFDYGQLGGTIKRAPARMRKMGLEWLWRLGLQPKRFRRQLAIPAFISRVKNEKRNQK